MCLFLSGILAGFIIEVLCIVSLTRSFIFLIMVLTIKYPLHFRKETKWQQKNTRR